MLNHNAATSFFFFSIYMRYETDMQVNQLNIYDLHKLLSVIIARIFVLFSPCAVRTTVDVLDQFHRLNEFVSGIATWTFDTSHLRRCGENQQSNRM